MMRLETRRKMESKPPLWWLRAVDHWGLRQESVAPRKPKWSSLPDPTSYNRTTACRRTEFTIGMTSSFTRRSTTTSARQHLPQRTSSDTKTLQASKAWRKLTLRRWPMMIRCQLRDWKNPIENRWRNARYFCIPWWRVKPFILSMLTRKTRTRWKKLSYKVLFQGLITPRSIRWISRRLPREGRILLLGRCTRLSSPISPKNRFQRASKKPRKSPKFLLVLRVAQKMMSSRN